MKPKQSFFSFTFFPMLSELSVANGRPCPSNCPSSTGIVLRNSSLQQCRKLHAFFLPGNHLQLPSSGIAVGQGRKRHTFSQLGFSVTNTIIDTNEPLLNKYIQPRTDRTERLLVNLDLTLYRAREFARTGLKQNAEELLLKCISDWPDDGRAYVSLGKLLVKQKRMEEAREVYENGCQAMRGENAYIWQAWAVLEEKCGNISQARRLFDAATVANPKHAPAWHGWALLELRQGNTQKAKDLLNKGLKLAGANEYIYQTLAEMEKKVGRIEEARSLYLLSSKANPSSCPTWVSWGLMEAENGDTNSARKLFQKALEVSPKNRYAFQSWAILEGESGNKTQARILFQRGKDLNPKDAALIQAFALFEYECGYVGVARNLLQEASIVDPFHLPVWIARGWLEWKEGNVEDARKYYRRAVKIDNKSPKSARVFQAWGVLEDRQGNYGAARELFKYAIKMNPNDKVAWLSWSSMEERSGNYIRAEELRQLYLQQRTEVVDDSWELTNLIAPAVNKMKTFFKLQDALGGVFAKETVAEMSDEEECDELLHGKQGKKIGRDFDVDAFLAERIPKEFNYITNNNRKSKSQWRREIVKEQEKSNPKI